MRFVVVSELPSSYPCATGSMQVASEPKESFLEIINPKLHPFLPFMVYIAMCGLEGYGWFLSDFGLKRGMEFDHFRMKYGMTLA